MCGILAILFYNGGNPAAFRSRALDLSARLRHRGPDWSGIHVVDDRMFICHERLAIVDPDSGDQPLYGCNGDDVIVTVNGEIYNHAELMSGVLQEMEHRYNTKSDCEIISHMYEQFGEDLCQHFDGMYAFTVVDRKNNTFMAARDPIGQVPCYVGYGKDGSVWIASEMKVLAEDCEHFEILPPGHIYSSKTNSFRPWYTPRWITPGFYPQGDCNMTKLRDVFTSAVKKRLMSDVPFGVLLSGGLDSSLVASVAVREIKRDQELLPFGAKLHSFSIGLKGSPDLAAAKVVADFIGTHHHEFTFTVQEGLDAIASVIYFLETFDVTTVRASTPMYLMTRKIKSMGVKMVLSGEGSDEIFGGYLYFHKAPNKEEFHDECVRKLRKLHQYDCLRANKSTSAWGVEARCPFLDKELIRFAMEDFSAEHKMCKDRGDGRGSIEKWVIRKAFEDKENPYLPDNILWRQKEQFSDGVGYGWIDGIKKYAEESITDQAMKMAALVYPDDTPKTKEAYLYRSIFEHKYPHSSAHKTVPGGPSVACSTETAIKWDASFQQAALQDPSGRAVLGVHKAAYLDTADNNEPVSKRARCDNE